MSVPLVRHNLVRTRDADEARFEVAQQFCAHELTLTGRGAGLDVVHNGYRLGWVGLNYLRYGAEVRIQPVAFERFWLVQIPLTGRAVIRTDGHVVHSDPRVASMPSPDVPADMSWGAGNEQLIVYLDRATVQRHSGRTRRARSRPGLRAGGAPGVAAAAELAPADRLRPGEIDAGGAARDPADPQPARGPDHHRTAQRTTQQRVRAAVRRARPGHQPYGASGGGTDRGVARAAWRVEELARAVGVSARTLQENFQHDRGQSPMQVLRRVRLQRAHDELVVSDHQSTTVTRWRCGGVSGTWAASPPAIGACSRSRRRRRWLAAGPESEREPRSRGVRAKSPRKTDSGRALG